VKEAVIVCLVCPLVRAPLSREVDVL